MQAVQDLSVEDRVSRTQFQYSLEAADPKELAHVGAAARGQAASLCRSCATWPPTSKTTALEENLVVDRDTASRLGLTDVGHRQHALRRFRTAAGVHHVHAAQSVSRGAGSRPGIPAKSGCAEELVCEIRQRGSRCR